LNYPVSFTPEAVFAAGLGGKDAKIVYRQALSGIYMPDSVGTGSNLRQVTLYLDVMDVLGNSYSGQVTLTVQ